MGRDDWSFMDQIVTQAKRIAELEATLKEQEGSDEKVRGMEIELASARTHLARATREEDYLGMRVKMLGAELADARAELAVERAKKDEGHTLRCPLCGHHESDGWTTPAEDAEASRRKKGGE